MTYHKPLDYESSDGLTRHAHLAGQESITLQGELNAIDEANAKRELAIVGIPEDPILITDHIDIPIAKDEGIGESARIIQTAIGDSL